MIVRRSAVKLLNENPATETVTWIVGEPTVRDLIADPVVHAVLRRDGLSKQDLMRAIARGRHRLSGTTLSSTTAAATGPIPITPPLEMPSSESAGKPGASDAA